MVLVPGAVGAGHVEDDVDGFVGVALVVVVDGAVRVQELVGDVSQDGGAAWGDAAFGDLDKKIGEEFVDGDSGLEVREFPDEFGGEVKGVTLGLLARGAHGGTHGEMVKTKTKMRLGGGVAAAFAIGETMLAAGGVVLGCNSLDFNGGAGVRRRGVHDFLVGGYTPPWKWKVVKAKALLRGHFAMDWKQERWMAGNRLLLPGRNSPARYLRR
jgi:hypothetical protein